jgi:acyl phosphate:glycerol-3-phosphate acyltransferase
MLTALAIAAAYLLGSVSFGIVVSRLMRLPDPRKYGSKNPGATNVLRTGRKAAAVLTLIGDAGKGFLAVWVASVTTGDAALAGVAVFLGHLFPIFHRFKGGKGVATAAGVLFGFELALGLSALAVWIATAALFRFSSLAALLAATLAPVYWIGMHGFDAYALALIVMAAFIAWRHRENVSRLAKGTEPRLGVKKAT